MKYTSILTLLLLGIALVSCSSDDEQQQDTDGRKLRQLTIAEVPVTRATLSDSGSTLGAAWEAGDLATYFNVTTFRPYDMHSGVLTASASASTSAFTGTVYCTTHDMVALFYPHQDVPIQDPNRGKFTVKLAGQDGTLATIAKNFHYVYGVAEVTSVTENTANATISNMKSLLAVAKFTFTDGTNPIPVKTLTINYGDKNVGYPPTATVTPSADVSNVSPVPVGSKEWNPLTVTLGSETTDGVYVALLPISKFDFHFTVTNSSGTYTGTAKATLKEGKYYPVELKLTSNN